MLYPAWENDLAYLLCLNLNPVLARLEVRALRELRVKHLQLSIACILKRKHVYSIRFNYLFIMYYIFIFNI